MNEQLDGGMRRVAICAAIAIAATLRATHLGAQTLTVNSDPTATLAAGVRYRNLGGSGPGGTAEALVFSSPCCVTPNSAQGTWPASSTFPSPTATAPLPRPRLARTLPKGAGNLGDLNYIQIHDREAGPDEQRRAEQHQPGRRRPRVRRREQCSQHEGLEITGANFTSGFTLTRTLATTDLSGGGDSNFVQIEVGCAVPPDNQGPVTSSVATAPIPALLNGLVTVTANISDETTGGNNVASADYQLNGGGGWTGMTASDGAFKSPNEDVETSFTAVQLGTNEVCVRGTDAAGNTGVAACQTFLVT